MLRRILGGHSCGSALFVCVDLRCGGGARDTQGLSALSQSMEQEEDTDTEAARTQTAAQ